MTSHEKVALDLDQPDVLALFYRDVDAQRQVIRWGLALEGRPLGESLSSVRKAIGLPDEYGTSALADEEIAQVCPLVLHVHETYDALERLARNADALYVALPDDLERLWHAAQEGCP